MASCEMDDTVPSDIRELASQFGVREVVGSAGGEAVRVHLDGMRRVTRVEIASEVTADVAMLEELVAAAMTDALAQVGGEGQRIARDLLAQLTRTT